MKRRKSLSSHDKFSIHYYYFDTNKRGKINFHELNPATLDYIRDDYDCEICESMGIKIDDKGHISQIDSNNGDYWKKVHHNYYDEYRLEAWTT